VTGALSTWIGTRFEESGEEVLESGEEVLESGEEVLESGCWSAEESMFGWLSGGG